MRRTHLWLGIAALVAIFAAGFLEYGCGGSNSSSGSGAPVITSQPSNQTVSAGQMATFSVSATGQSPLAYQWSENGAAISGATSSTYTTAATTTADSGSTFDVTVSNSLGSATSSSASLTVSTGSGGNSIASVLTYHNDVGRTGQNLNETTLTTSNVNSSSFGKVGFLTTTGKVDAEPLYVSALTIGGAAHNVVFVATEHDLVYAFDADTFTQLWQTSVLGTGETTSDPHNCGQITPEIGITSTPVIDPKAGAHGTIFVVAMSKDSSGNYHQRLHALDLTTGAEQSGSPVDIQATYPSATGQNTFDPYQYAERSGLLLLNGVVYMGWTSHCDQNPYQGWLMGYSESTLKQTSVLDVTPNGSEGSIWMSGAGLAADPSGAIYFLDANGDFDTNLNAGNNLPANGNYGNSFMKVSTSGGTLTIADYFTMHNTVSESNADEDLGSGGALVLPDQTGSSGTVHLAVGAGKDGTIYVVNRDKMGKFNSSNDSAIYQEVSGEIGGQEFAMPAYFNSTVYYGAVSTTLRAFPIASAKLAASPSSMSSATFGYPGTTPSISANGSSNGIVWAVENTGAGGGGGNGILHAYDATNLATEFYNSNQAASGRDSFVDNKFITPMIAGGKVYVGTPTGVVVFGLLK
ncbi:MAG: immunoglobulin domain-containing protein [Candidatus Acidiferrales bacterium]